MFVPAVLDFRSIRVPARDAGFNPAANAAGSAGVIPVDKWAF